MAREADYYSAHETARLLGLSPARVRQLLRSGELAGERGPGIVEGVPGPWRVPAGAVDAFRRGERRAVAEPQEAETVAMPREGFTTDGPEDGAPRTDKPTGEDTPSEASERLSEAVGALRSKTEELLEELDRLEGRLETAEVQEIALREAARQEKQRADTLRAELDAAKGERGTSALRSRWRNLLGG